MSVVVAIRRGVQTIMAADQLIHDDISVKPPDCLHATSKFVRVGTTAIGVVGYSVYKMVLLDYASKLRKMPKFENEHAVFEFFLRFWRALRLHYHFVRDQTSDESSPFVDLNARFLLGTKKAIFQVDRDLGVTRYETYAAIGSGGEFALGALRATFDLPDMELEEVAKRAVGAATAFDSYCGGGTEFVRI